MKINENRFYNRKCFGSLGSGDIFKDSSNNLTCMKVSLDDGSDSKLNAVVLSNGILCHFEDQEEVIPPMEDPVLNINFIDA